MMKRFPFLSCFFIPLLFFVLFIDPGRVTAETVQVTIQKVSLSPKIDGFLEPSFWNSIVPLTDFVQYDPYNGQPPSEKTFVYLAYDEDNLYIAFNCLDSQPKIIKGDLTPREVFRPRENDNVAVYLDTYFDKRNCYSFFVNPRGVQRDQPGDYVWKSAAVINLDGWSAELMIPFKSIRFPTGSQKPWGVNFQRYIFRVNELSYLTAVKRDEVFLEKSATLNGLIGIRGGKNFEFFPYAGYRNSASGDTKESKLAAGLDAKYSITSNLNLDLASSPDFSEVESDPFFYQLTPYEYYLGEKRPFFQEAGNYFGYQLFYTKRVTNPKLAFKLTGKEKGYTVGLLGALNKGGDGKNEYLGVCNIKKNIFSLSNISFIYSGYKTPAFTNQNGGVSLNLTFSQKSNLYAHSNFTFNSDRKKGDNGFYVLNYGYYPDEGISFFGNFQRIEKNYLPRAGYYNMTDSQNWYLSSGYSKRINKYGIKKVDLWCEGMLRQDSSGQYLGYYISPLMINFQSLKEHWAIIYLEMGERKTQIYENNRLEWSKNTFKIMALTGDLSYQGSRFYAYEVYFTLARKPVYNSQFTQAFDGDSLEMTSDLTLKPTSFLNFSISLNHTKQNIRATGEKVFEGNLYGLRVNYQISRYAFISSYVQHDSHYKRINLDFLLGVELGMGNEMNISYKGFYPFEDSPYLYSARSFVIKASYLIRL